MKGLGPRKFVVTWSVPSDTQKFGFVKQVDKLRELMFQANKFINVKIFSPH